MPADHRNHPQHPSNTRFFVDSDRYLFYTTDSRLRSQIDFPMIHRSRRGEIVAPRFGVQQKLLGDLRAYHRCSLVVFSRVAESVAVKAREGVVGTSLKIGSQYVCSHSAQLRVLGEAHRPWTTNRAERHATEKRDTHS